jgi:recombination protein RecA
MLANYNLRGQEAPADSGAFFYFRRGRNALGQHKPLCYNSSLQTHPQRERKHQLNMADERNERNRAIDLAIASIEKQFGKGSIMRLGEKKVVDIPAISTSCLSLDAAVGIGGVPRGRIVEIYGPESGGKTTLALHIVSQAQIAGGVAAYIDAEHAMDAKYAARLGVKVNDLFISQPDSGEQALEIAEALVRSGGVDVLVIDSVAALVPRAELDGDMGDSLPGLQARLMSQALRKLTAVVARSNTCLIFINQIREKIGVMFGNPETTTGGRALKFYSSLRLEIRRTSSIKDGDSVVGNRTKVKVVKNKVAPPFKEAEFDIMYGLGISREGDVLDLAVEHKIVEKSGAWFSFQGERLGQGRENVKNLIKAEPGIAGRIEVEVRKALGLIPADNVAVEAEAAAPSSGSSRRAAPKE